MELIYAIISFAIGFGIAAIIGRSHHATTSALLDAEKKARQEDNTRASHQLEQQKKEAEERLLMMRDEAGLRLEEEKQSFQEQYERQKADFEKRMTALKSDNQEQRTRELTELRRSYEEQLALFKEQVTTTTEKLLKDRSNELQSSNTQQMDALFKPIRENISKMEQSMNENRDAQTRNTSSFETTMKQMMERTHEIGQQADRLSNALQHKNKTMGNWGELILTDLLESQGLRKGYEYEAQQTLRNDAGLSIRNEESGARMIPDVVLHLADHRDLIIDAKVSLTAFVDYTNAETDDAREEAAKRHLDSIRNHIKELATKDYSKYVAKSRNSSDFVIMFVPNDGALQLLLQREPELWNDAFNQKKVFIVGSQTLIAALHIIDLTWQQVRQERNTQKIMDEARKLIDRVEQFYQKFLSVGRKLDEAKKAYTEVTDKVKDGQQSILGAGRNLELLGVRGKKSLSAGTDEEG